MMKGAIMIDAELIREEEELIKVMRDTSVGIDEYNAALSAIERIEKLKREAAEAEQTKRRLEIEEAKLENEQSKLDLEERKFEAEVKPSKFKRFLDVAKIAAGPIASIVTVVYIVVAEKKDDLFLGSKAMNKIPKP